MTHRDSDVDARLRALGQATESVRARHDFSARVMGAIAEAEPRGFWGDLLAPARRVIPVAAVKGRYVRFHSKGNSAGPSNDYVEAEVWGVPAK